MKSVAISIKVLSSNSAHGEVYSNQHYVIQFISDLRQVGGFPHQWNWLPRYNWYIVASDVNHHRPSHLRTVHFGVLLLLMYHNLSAYEKNIPWQIQSNEIKKNTTQYSSNTSNLQMFILKTFVMLVDPQVRQTNNCYVSCNKKANK